MKKSPAYTTGALDTPSYKFGPYVFRLYDEAKKIFRVNKGKIAFANPDAIEIYQYVENNRPNGAVKEIFINRRHDNPALVYNYPEIYQISRNIFLSFLNGDGEVKRFLLGVLSEPEDKLKAIQD